MAHTLKLKDGSVHTCLTEQGFYDLVGTYTGKEAMDYVRDIIADTALMAQQADQEEYEKLNEEYTELEEKYKALDEAYKELEKKYEFLQEMYKALKEELLIDQNELQEGGT